jgi:hypothetical protein
MDPQEIEALLGHPHQVSLGRVELEFQLLEAP